MIGDCLSNNKSMSEGHFLKSNNGAYNAILQQDGNFVLYTSCDFRQKMPIGLQKLMGMELAHIIL